MNPSDIHILVIDDEEPNRLLISRQLQRDGYQVATVSSGAEGLSYLEGQRVDLIFLDLRMPELSGYDVLAHLKADPNLASISVVIVSANDDLKDIIRCLDMGADDYLLKPFNPLLLRVRLHTCLERQWLRQQERAYLQQLRTERDLAEAANRARSAFLANMSHELRTPLNAVIGYTDILQEEFEAEGYVDYTSDLEKIRGASRHLLGLINDILDISKLESGTMELNLETFHVGELLAQVEADLQFSSGDAPRSPLASTANTLTFNLDLPPGLQLHTDRSKLQQILTNVLSNALKFTPKGEIHLNAALKTRSNAANWIHFTVVDTGIGIPPEQQARIFEPFTQVDDSSTRAYGGTGLGLAICHRLSQLLGGTIQVESAVNQGTTVTLQVPTHLTPNDAIAARVFRFPVVPSVPQLEHDPKLVLVIDGDRAVRDWMVGHLSQSGCRVITSWNGEEGLRLAKDLHPALIFLEATLAGTGPWFTLAALKANPDLMDIPVVLHALQPSSVSHEVQGIVLGACHYLTKPDHYRHILTLLAPYATSTSHAASKSVMLIQGDRTTQHMLQRLLMRHQWTVQTAATLPEAIAQPTPKAIILDVDTLADSSVAAWTDLQAQLRSISIAEVPSVSGDASHDLPIIHVLTHEFGLADSADLVSRIHRHLIEGLKTQIDAVCCNSQSLANRLQVFIRAYCGATH